jgi:hypothetical protein
MDVERLVGNVREESERAYGKEKGDDAGYGRHDAMMRFPRARYPFCASTCSSRSRPVGKMSVSHCTLIISSASTTHFQIKQYISSRKGVPFSSCYCYGRMRGWKTDHFGPGPSTLLVSFRFHDHLTLASVCCHMICPERSQCIILVAVAIIYGKTAADIRGHN